MDNQERTLFDANTIREGAANTSSIQSGSFEIQQKNIISFENQVESAVVSQKDLRRIRKLCESAPASSWPKADICLSIASLFAGTSLSMLIASVPFDSSFKSIVFYIVAPMIAVGCGVAFFFLRKEDELTTKKMADLILDYLPDAETLDKETSNEH